MEDFETEIFGKYYLVDRIATGGMAEVFRAKTFAVGGFESLFVVKRILAHLGEDPEFVAMFVDEAKISVVLQHPNIVRVFDFGKEEAHFFIAMEHVEGRDLRRVLRAAAHARTLVPYEVALWVVSEATKGLQFAHTRTDGDTSLGIVHRDISPANLLLSTEGDVKVADFGIAKAESNLIQTDGALLKGKYAYMSPEQVTGKPVDARSDVFSLGIVLYEMLTGRRAFRGEDDDDTLRRVREVDLPAPREVRDTIPEAMEAVALKALAADPEERYQSAREFGEALRAAHGTWSDDAMREGLTTWLQELVGDDIATDRERLDEGSKIASAMHALRQEMPDEEPPPPANNNRIVVLVALLFLALGVGWIMTQSTEVPEVAVASTGSLDFDITPAAKIFVSGRQVGDGEVVNLRDLAPGDYDIRIEAEGYQPIEESVRVTRGGATRVRHSLVRGLGAEAPIVKFRSTPPGATVEINAERVGVTPLDWVEGLPSKSYAVTLKLDGHDDWSGTLDGLKAKETKTVSRTLRVKATPRPVAAAVVTPPAPAAVKTPRPVKPTPAPVAKDGSLRVVLSGATWANVYVDGKKLSRTAPFSGFTLSPGSHTVRVENSAAGLDYTKKVTVSSGGSATVRALAR